MRKTRTRDQPKGAIERTYVRDVATLICESQRLRSYKNITINNSRLAALRSIVQQLLCRRDFDGYDDHEHAAEDLARNWFSNKEAQTRVAKLLRQFQMAKGPSTLKRSNSAPSTSSGWTIC